MSHLPPDPSYYSSSYSAPPHAAGGHSQPKVWTPPPSAQFADPNAWPQDQPQYQEPNPHSQSSSIHSRPHSMGMAPPTPSSAGPQFPVNEFFTNPVARMAINTYGAQIQQQFGGLFGFFNLHKLRYYFHVDHEYVLKKLKILFLPFVHKHWRRERVEGEGSPFKPPVEDLNAPDLYIPLMGFVSYVLFLAYATAQQNQFHPEILGLFASRTLVFLFLEVMALKAGFWLISAPYQPPITDLVAYCAYIYVPLLAMMVIGLILGPFCFYLSILGLGLTTGLFMIRTFKSVLTPGPDAQSLHAAQHVGTARRNYFLVAIGGLQVVLAFALVKGTI